MSKLLTYDDIEAAFREEKDSYFSPKQEKLIRWLVDTFEIREPERPMLPEESTNITHLSMSKEEVDKIMGA